MNESKAEHAKRMAELQKSQKETLKEKTIKRGVVIVNTGDGKGKSTSGFGVAIRALGHGQKVAIVQFIKGTWTTGEGLFFKRFPEVTHIVSGEGFTWDTQDRDRDIEAATAGFEAAKEAINSGEYDVVILDEINVAADFKYLEAGVIAHALAHKPEHVSIVLTGRNAPQEIIDAADTVTEMQVVKHAFDAGILARKGVEF